jgi:hypothetical protein
MALIAFAIGSVRVALGIVAASLQLDPQLVERLFGTSDGHSAVQTGLFVMLSALLLGFAAELRLRVTGPVSA